MWSFLGLLHLGWVLLDLSHYAAIFAIGEVGVWMIFELKFHELVYFHLLDHVLGELLLVDVDAWIAEAHGVA